jgi:Pyruvate/2-oxoacid:ferredoxin oxidoreductase delta subunit
MHNAMNRYTKKKYRAREVQRLNDDNDWLIKKINTRTEELKAGMIEPSLVIPVNQAFSVTQKVLPKEQVQEILGNAKIIAQIECECRSKVQGCNSPTDVCIVINTIAKNHIKDGRGRKITITEANEILDKTAQYGLVHLTLYVGGHDIDAICSCCSCCCSDLRAILDFGVLDLVLKSDYRVEFDKEKCITCGTCIERCHFNAHTEEDRQIIFSPEKCYGCGLCVMSCPAEAVKLVKRE